MFYVDVLGTKRMPPGRRDSRDLSICALIHSYDVTPNLVTPKSYLLSLGMLTCIFNCFLDLFGYPHTSLIQNVLNSLYFPE